MAHSVLKETGVRQLLYKGLGVCIEESMYGIDKGIYGINVEIRELS